MTKTIDDILALQKCKLPRLKLVFNSHKILLEELEKSFLKFNKNKKLIIRWKTIFSFRPVMSPLD